MAATIINGKDVAAKLNAETKEMVAAKRAMGIVPCLTVILVGEDPASISYVTAKKKALMELGMEGKDITLSDTISETELLDIIKAENEDKSVHGILVQLPLPKHIRESIIMEAILPEKDVDCFSAVSIGRMLRGDTTFLPCTPHGVIVLLMESKIPLAGSHAVVVGRSNIVGKPLALLLARREANSTVTICHTGTRDLKQETLRADILIAAAGMPGLITGDMIKEGAAVIDVGVNRVADPSKKSGFSLKGDVVYEEALAKAGYITPVPGGVGPMTIAMLMRNVVLAAL
jgi:methylenetetrahydrofolate dehydrogenase (NADP+)/methenyltetrahydrofolate cyclohydrolase